MRDNGSMYDFAGADYVAPAMEDSKPIETPHQNRPDLSKPYAGTFSEKVKQASTGDEPKTSSSNQWWIYFTRQQTRCQIAMKINSGFDRNSLNGENYYKERERYIKLHKELSE